MKRLFDNTQAYSEGWGLWTLDSNVVQIQRLDDPQSVNESYPVDPVFISDDAAIAYVKEKAKAGSKYHQLAMSFHSRFPRIEVESEAVHVKW